MTYLNHFGDGNNIFDGRRSARLPWQPASIERTVNPEIWQHFLKCWLSKAKMIETRLLMELNRISSNSWTICQCSYGHTSHSLLKIQKVETSWRFCCSIRPSSLKHKLRHIFKTVWEIVGFKQSPEKIPLEFWRRQGLSFPWTKSSDGFPTIWINTLVQKPFLPGINQNQTEELLDLVFVVSTVTRDVSKTMLEQV